MQTTTSVRVQNLLEPLIEELGYELVLLEYFTYGRSGTLRLFIDSDAGIGLEDCEKVSREVAAIMDVEDPIKDPYHLEVSSPGLDRPLVKPAHFQRFVGEEADILLFVPRDGRRKFLGELAGTTANGVKLRTKAGEIELEFSEIERARLVPRFN